MRSWFGKRSYAVVNATDPVQAYRAGRIDERRTLETDPAPARAGKAELDAAYEQGRRDERGRHRGAPLVTLLVALVALFGGMTLYLAARDGGFRAAGATVDNTLASGAQDAKAPIRNAANKTGDALQTAGRNLKNDASPPRN